MAREHMLQVRMSDEELSLLKQLYERWRVTGMSELIRLLVQFAYENPGVIEYYIEQERGE